MASDSLVSAGIVIRTVAFLEHFVRWESPGETLDFAVALAVVIAALVVFQRNNKRAKEFDRTHPREAQTRAQSEMFQGTRIEIRRGKLTSRRLPRSTRSRSVQGRSLD